MAKTKTVLACAECRQQVSQWLGRCPGCGAWGTIQEVSGGAPSHDVTPTVPRVLGAAPEDERRVSTEIPGVDRVLGGGLVPASVVLLAGEPGIGKSTLLLQLLGSVVGSGRPCLLVSGEESHAQVAARANRLGVAGDNISFAPGRDLGAVLDTARQDRPFLLAVDSIQTIRDPDAAQLPGGPSQVRLAVDALVGLAKAEGIAVLVAGHVTKHGDLAGPRTLEHAVDVVLGFDGDPRSGLRILSCGKNRFGAEGETAWFEMGPAGLHEIDPTALLVSVDPAPGAATALPQSGRRALAVEVQALLGPTEGSPRRQATGLDLRRFQLVAAVLDRATGIPFGRSELFGASSGGARLDDPACDLAVAAALVSAATGIVPPAGAAFVGEVALTGLVRRAPAMDQRLAAAGAAGCALVFAPEVPRTVPEGVRVVSVRHVVDALAWALPPVENRTSARAT